MMRRESRVPPYVRGDGFASARRRRPIAAILLVVGLISALVASGVVERATSSTGAAGASYVAQQAGFSAVMGISSGKTYAVQPEVATAAFSGELPSFFGKEDVLLDESSSIAAYLARATVPSARSDLAERMESIGWVCVESGSGTFETFRKEGGAYRWAIATYAEIGDRVRVTIQCA